MKTSNLQGEMIEFLLSMSSCHKGRVVLWVEFFQVELSQGSSCHKGRVVTWVELSHGSSCHMGQDDLTPDTYPRDSVGVREFTNPTTLTNRTGI